MEGMSDIRNEIEQRLGVFARPSAKAKMGRAEDLYRRLNVSVTLSNAKEMERLASEALRMPDFMPEGNDDWTLHELAEEAGRQVLALKSRASRPGANAAFAQPPFSSSNLNALKRLAQEYDKKAKESKGKRTDSGMNAEWEAASIADHLREIVTYAQSGQTHRAYAQVRMSSPDIVRILPASLVKAAQDATKFSRPGTKAKFGSSEIDTMLNMLASQVVDQKDLARKNAKNVAEFIYEHGTVSQIEKFLALANRVGLHESMARPDAKANMGLEDACWKGYEAVGMKTKDGKDVPNCVPKATAAKLDDKTECADCETEQDKAGLKLMEKADKAVSDKIRTLIKEGKPQDQAVAIALDMKRRGEL